jgi:hypothetical protein
MMVTYLQEKRGGEAMSMTLPLHLFFQLSVARAENKLSLKSGIDQNRPEKTAIALYDYNSAVSLHNEFSLTHWLSHNRNRLSSRKEGFEIGYKKY